jgi:hypothetical protein
VHMGTGVNLRPMLLSVPEPGDVQIVGPYKLRSTLKCPSHLGSVLTAEQNGVGGNSTLGRLIGIGAAVTHRPLPHHRAYGSVHGGSSQLR